MCNDALNSEFVNPHVTRTRGFMVDVRHALREMQEIAFDKGLIPYIPADRQ
jgi:hypothetical protein